MKLKKLTIHNLASIADATIDFDGEPLKEAPLFLLCGETGSGKTTVLDAVCLALYGHTPRYEDNAKNRSVEVNGLPYNDALQLVRRGTGEARVTLLLQGNDGRTYEACWGAEAYKKAAAKGKLNPKSEYREWKCLESGTVTTFAKSDGMPGTMSVPDPNDATGKKKIQVPKPLHPLIAQVIGLDFQQFTRTTMLAQGQFTKFLLSDDAEKAEILEKLTDTSRFTILGKRIASLFAEKEGKVKSLDLEIKKLGGLGEKRGGVEQTLREQKGKAEKKGAAEQAAKAQVDWEASRLDLLKKKDDAWTWLKCARAVVETEAFREEEKTLHEWDESQAIHPWLLTSEQASNSEEDAARSLATAAKEFGELRGCSEDLARKINEKKNTWQTLKQELDRRAERVPLYDAVQVVVANLREARTADQEAVNLADKIAGEQNETLPRLRQDAEDAKRELNEKEQAGKELEARISGLDAQLQALGLDSVRIQKETLLKHQHGLELLGELCNGYDRTQETLQNLKADKDKAEKAVAKLEAEWPDLRQRAENAGKESADAKAKYQHQSDLLEAGLEKVVAHLHIGDICPVCQNKIEHLALKSEFAPLLAALKTDYAEKDKKWEAAKDRLKTNESELKETRRTVDRLGGQLTAQERAVAQLAGQIDEKVAELGLADAAVQTLATANQNDAERIANLDATIQQGTEIEDSLRKLRGSLDDSKQQVEEARRIADEAGRKVETAETQIKLLASKKAVQDRISLDKKAAAGTRLPMDWMAAWMADPEGYEENLLHEAADYSQKKNDVLKLSNQIDVLGQQQEQLAHSLDGIAAKQPAWLQEHPARQAEFDDQTQERANDLSARVESANRQLETARNNLAEAKAHEATFFAAHPDLTRMRVDDLRKLTDIPHRRQNVASKKEKVKNREGAWTQASESYDEHLAKRPEGMPAGATREQLQAVYDERHAAVGIVNQKIGELKQILADDDARGEERRKKETERKAAEDERQEWEPLNTAFGDSEGKKIRLVIQSYVLRNVLLQANRYLKQLSDRYELACVGLTLTVKDFYEGGVERPAKTLSGGEGFLVSLALALGLAAMNETGLSVDMLFIDEGFGTLSGEHLNAAIEALERLNELTGSRKVGIISHVERLRERIPIHIEVTREGHEPSKVKVSAKILG